MIDSANATLIGVAVVLAIQGGVGLFWGGAITADLKRLKDDVLGFKAFDGKIVRLESQIGALIDRLDEFTMPAASRRRRPHEET